MLVRGLVALAVVFHIVFFWLWGAISYHLGVRAEAWSVTYVLGGLALPLALVAIAWIWSSASIRCDSEGGVRRRRIAAWITGFLALAVVMHLVFFWGLWPRNIVASSGFYSENRGFTHEMFGVAIPGALLVAAALFSFALDGTQPKENDTQAEEDDSP